MAAIVVSTVSGIFGLAFALTVTILYATLVATFNHLLTNYDIHECHHLRPCLARRGLFLGSSLSIKPFPQLQPCQWLEEPQTLPRILCLKPHPSKPKRPSTPQGFRTSKSFSVRPAWATSPVHSQVPTGLNKPHHCAWEGGSS